ncbi:MAG: helix-turn-helix domain-containing protein, partial [Nakamurella sp.]
ALVDGIVRGENPDSLASRAAALGWDPIGPVAVLVGTARIGGRDGRDARHVTDWAHTRAVTALSGVQGGRLVVVLTGWPAEDAGPGTPGGRGALVKEHPFPADVESLFGDGPIVHGPPASGLDGAVRSSEEAFAGLRVAHAWTGGTRLLSSADLLVERVLAGDDTAIRRLRDTVYTPLAAASTPLLETVDGYLEHGAALEPAARSLFIHPNTLRYRLHRVAELTGFDPWNPRDVAALRIALILGRLRR